MTVAYGARYLAVAAPNIPLPTITKSTTASFPAGSPQVIWSGYRRCDDEFGRRVTRDLRCAADDEVGAFPGALAGLEGHLLGHPVAVVLLSGHAVDLPDPGEVAALGFPFVGLDPDGYVDQVRALPAGGADALDDQQRAARGDLDRARRAALVPGGGR